VVPQEKNAAVLRGLHQAFGGAAIEEIRSVPKGLGSDLVFRIVVQGAPYVLRIMTRIDERMDPDRIFTSMRAAAEAAVAPAVRYANTEDGVSITDFVEAVSFPATRALRQLPPTLRTLHTLPPFPKTFNYVTAHNGFIWRFRKAGLLPQDEVEEVFTRYEQVCAAYPRLDSDMVSCHSDLKPENILFDGYRLWLVDWRAAFVNDRYFDLAVAANFVVTDDADEWTWLERYFGQPPDEYQRARFFSMRQVVHMLTATVFLILGSAGKPIGQTDDLPSFGDFHRQLWAGEVNLADDARKIVYGMVHWRQLQQNLQQARFDESLGIVSQKGVRLLLPPAP
jgi:aminoglycoside phosphotransferase (APT) family kinase protein